MPSIGVARTLSTGIGWPLTARLAARLAATSLSPSAWASSGVTSVAASRPLSSIRNELFIFSSTSRVMVGMQALQARLRHMGIDLRGRQVTVAQQQLYDTQVGPMIQQMGGKGVPQGMGRQRTLDAGGARMDLDAIPEGLARHGAIRSEEHTSELQSRPHLVCRLLLEKK